MNHSVEYAERPDAEGDQAEQPLSVSHLVRTLRAYGPVIILTMLSVAVGYTLVATLLYITSPAQRTTTQPFRLEFRGATEGSLPNGVRFSPIEIISTPVLLKVYRNGELGRFTTFSAFSKSIFVLEANKAYESLAAEYQARLSDPKLTAIDRERIQKEFELKRDSISKSDYAIGYAPTPAGNTLPDTVTRKVLLDILNTWAAFAINEQHALDYRVAVLTPQILDQGEISSSDPIIAIEILRSKIYRVIENIEDINALPSAELMKTADRMSLAEIRMRLEDIVRFHLEPLVGVARSSGLVSNPAYTVHFLESQLAYDQRSLQAAQTHVKAARDALAMYTSDQARLADATAAATGATRLRPRGAPGGEGGETVMPQLSDTFLDRLMTLSKQATDSQYRLKIITEYQRAVNATIPLEQAVSYEQQVLDQIKSAPASGARAGERQVTAEIEESTGEVRRLIGKVNEIYQLLSRNLSPSTQLFSPAGPPVTRIERAQTFSKLLLYGVVLLLVALPVIVVLCLLHNRMREEEAVEAARMITHPTEA